MRRPRNRTARAMTMVELLFVLVILGILLAVSLPRMKGSNQWAALQTTARDMAKLAVYARQSAISQAAETRLVVDLENRRWWMDLPREEERDRDARGRARDRLVLSTVEEAHTLHPKVSVYEIAVNDDVVKGDEAVVRFYPNGSSDGAVIVLRNERDRAMTIEIERATGRATAYAGSPKTFAERLQELGVDPTQFGLEVAAADDEARAGDDFYRIGQTADERVASYADAAARIMGRVNREARRAEDLERAVRELDRIADDVELPGMNREGRNR